MSKSIPPPKKLSSNYHYATQQVYNDVDNFESYSDSANLYVKTFEEIKIKHIICCIKDCFKKVKFECRCSTKPTFICKRHLPSHVKENKTHAPTVFDSKIHKKKWDKVVNYLDHYNSRLKDLKQTIISKVTKHMEKILKDVDCLFKNIDAIISKNTEKIKDLTGSSLKIIKNMKQLQSYPIKEFTKECKKISISNECLFIIQAEISNWNATMANQETVKLKKTSLLHVNDSDPNLENMSFKETYHDKPTKPRLHWCEWLSNKVHYFDWNQETHKSITIKSLQILEWSRSISIDYDNILLCGGTPHNIGKTNENTSKVYVINLKKQYFQTLASMKTGRADFCLTYLNGFYYVLGGADWKNYRINECERYSLENDRWEDIADLDHPRDLATCVSISKDNCIYIIGGSDNQDNLDATIERYDARKNIWFLIQLQKPILSQDLGCCLLPDTDFILIFGGKDSKNKCKKDCFLYYHETNHIISTYPISSDNNIVLNMPVISENKVFCYFGISNSERELSVYDIEKGVWATNPRE